MNSFYTTEELKTLNIKSFGKEVYISKKASIYGASNIEIGDHVRIDDFCILSGCIKIGSYVHIAAYAAMFAGNAGITLEDFSGVSSRVVIYAESDDYSGEFLTNPMTPMELRNVVKGPVYIGKHAIIGTGSSVIPTKEGLVIGEGAAIGAMSLVNNNIDEWTINVGIPAKAVKMRSKILLEKEKDMHRKKQDLIID